MEKLEKQWFRAPMKEVEIGDICLGCGKKVKEDDKMSYLFHGSWCGWLIYHISCLPKVLRSVCRGCSHAVKGGKGNRADCYTYQYINKI